MTDTFLTYLLDADRGDLDRNLHEFLTDVLRDWPAGGTKQEHEALIAKIMFVGVLHATRKRADLRAQGAHGLASAFEGDELKWVRAELARLNEVARRHERGPVVWTPSLPLRLAGFDPRYSSAAEAKAQWRQMLAPTQGTATTADIERSLFAGKYADAKRAIYLDFHTPATRYDLLLVDFVWLSELAYQGHLVPLDPYVPDLEETIKRKVASSLDIDMNAGLVKNWWRLTRHLASAGNDYVYAFPITVNYHGTLQRRNGTRPSNLNELFSQSAIQNQHSACLVYELYAHFAFHRATPLSLDHNAGRVTLAFTTSAAMDALSDYLARLLFALNSADVEEAIRAFRIDHKEEVDLLTGTPAPFAQDACFNAELYTEALEAEWEFHKPYTNRTGSPTSMLTSLGGYGLAVSRQSVNPERAIELARTIFQAGNFPGNVPLDLSRVGDMDSFLSIHCRPRLPFWSHVEELISVAVEDLFSAFTVDLLRSRQKFSDIQPKVRQWLGSGDGGIVFLKNLEKRIKLACENSGWAVNPQA